MRRKKIKYLRITNQIEEFGCGVIKKQFNYFKKILKWLQFVTIYYCYKNDYTIRNIYYLLK